MTETIRILLIDDQTTIRHALQVLLEQEQDFEIVGSAANGPTGIEQAQQLQPDIALIDIEMPGMNGIATAQKLRECSSETNVLMLTSHDGDGYLAEAFRAGAKGYLLKTTPGDDLANAIRAVHKGYGQVSPGLLERVVSQGTPSNGATVGASPNPVITPASVEAAAPAYPTAAEQIVPEVELFLVLKEFNGDMVLAIVERASASNGAIALLAYLNQFLKTEPTNLAALYLCGALSRRSSQYQQSAITFLRLGIREGLRQRLPLQELWLFYQEAAMVNPSEALTWLLQSGNLWLQSEQLPALMQDMARRCNPDSAIYQTCLAMYRLHRLRQMSDRYLTMQPQFETLRQRVSRLNTTFKP